MAKTIYNLFCVGVGALSLSVHAATITNNDEHPGSATMHVTLLVFRQSPVMMGLLSYLMVVSTLALSCHFSIMPR